MEIAAEGWTTKITTCPGMDDRDWERNKDGKEWKRKRKKGMEEEGKKGMEEEEKERNGKEGKKGAMIHTAFECLPHISIMVIGSTV